MAHTFVAHKHLKVFKGEEETALPYISGQPDDGTALAQALMASLHL
jgi:hypothetical protein